MKWNWQLENWHTVCTKLNSEYAAKDEGLDAYSRYLRYFLY